MNHPTSVELNLDKSVPIFSLSGEITGEQEEQIQKLWQTIPIDKLERVIFNFENADYINSSGIAILIRLATEATARKHQIELVNLTNHIKKVLELVGLLDFVKVHYNLSDALENK